MNIALFGFKCCGKTYFGRLLAKKTKKAFIDTDILIENLFQNKYNKTISCNMIYEEVGPLLFKAIENEVVLSLQDVQNSVLALGGSTILDTQNFETLKNKSKFVYIDTPAFVLKKRIFSAELPAFLKNSENPDAAFEIMYEDRKQRYEKINAIAIKTENKSDDEVIDEITTSIKNGK